MREPLERSASSSSLCRFSLKDEQLVTDALVKAEITAAFKEGRCFEFFPDDALLAKLTSGTPADTLRDSFLALRDGIFDTMSGGDQTIATRLQSDARLSARLTAALEFLHRALAAGNFTTLPTRRFVLVKERHGQPTLYHVSRETTVISHVGQGPLWKEIPTVYLGLNIFDALGFELKRGETALFAAFGALLIVEERAIETGFAHIEVYPPRVSRALNLLVNEVIRVSTQGEIEYREIPERKKTRRFTEKNRRTYLMMLDARRSGSELDFDHARIIKAIESLERLARRYKKGDDEASLREIVRLLVAASGHDLHEARNRASIALERIFSPKEFDAPLATRFINLQTGTEYRFRFKIDDEKSSYFLRLYRNSTSRELILERDLDFTDMELTAGGEAGYHTASCRFDAYGHYDFLVFKKKKKRSEALAAPGMSGRINVIPDIRGEIILEIFPDIHGHTGAFWRDRGGHPGLVYNEHGEVIRLGRFSDITAHLEQMKKMYSLTALYLLGVQKRGTNREDWAPEATSPSPFSPMSLVEIEPSLGGEEEFTALVSRAHELGIRIIVDIVPHLNRRSTELPDDYGVRCYDEAGTLVTRASTDGRYGSWNDGKLLNYRKFEVWEWLTRSVLSLIEKYDIDGIRFDSAHAVPIMMKRNNFLYIYNERRDHGQMVEGSIIVNDREDGHYVTTGYYDSACRDLIAIPFHYYMMLQIEKKLRERKKDFFINLAECYWGHERFLTRAGIIPYNSALFKICENIIHGKTDVREIYHVYDNYFPSSLPEGTELLGILGNHDERRALNTFGHRGLRAAVALTLFMSNIVLDYEGSAEGEGWKVYLDNIYVNWNQFEYAAHRSLDQFYREWYEFHREAKGKGFLVWANNPMVAAAMKFLENGIWIGAFSFGETNQSISIQFDSPVLPIPDDAHYRVVDPLYSPITGHYSFYTGRELKVSRINTIVSFTGRVKLLQLEEIADPAVHYWDFLRDSFFRLCTISSVAHFSSNYSFREISRCCENFETFSGFLREHLLPLFWQDHRYFLELGLKRALFHIFRNGLLAGQRVMEYISLLAEDPDEILSALGRSLKGNNERGPLVFMSAEAEPFSKSGGLANVVYELPRELAKQGEEVYVITGLFRRGDDQSTTKMRDALARYGITYTGRNVNFRIQETEYQVGVHSGEVEGIQYFLLDHFEFFDGLYWGVTAEEKLRRRIAFARACAEVICTFGLKPLFTFTNDAYAGIFNGIVRSDPVYYGNPNFQRTTFLHIIHNGGWQYFDAYHRYEKGTDLFRLFNLPSWRAWDFADPVFPDRLNSMASGIRFADRVITVSPSYAKQVEYACDGLERILNNVIGISNAIGEDFKDRIRRRFEQSGFTGKYFPRLLEKIRGDDPLRRKIEARYPEILAGEKAMRSLTDPIRREIVQRAANKMMLQIQRGFTVDPDILLFTMIHRITEQKGFQLLLDSSEGLFRHLGYQAVIGGAVSSGDKKGEDLANGLYLLGQYYRDQVSVSFGFQDVSQPLLSSDLFGMPSMNEPGGISQLEAFACGCLVVARATGGLRDTVFPVRGRDGEVEGNGFLFSDYSARAFYDAMERAAAFFRGSDEATRALARMNAERSIYYWDRPARQYIEEIYRLKEIVRIL